MDLEKSKGIGEGRGRENQPGSRLIKLYIAPSDEQIKQLYCASLADL